MRLAVELNRRQQEDDESEPQHQEAHDIWPPSTIATAARQAP
jgi:hypothetical protein